MDWCVVLRANGVKAHTALGPSEWNGCIGATKNIQLPRTLERRSERMHTKRREGTRRAPRTRPRWIVLCININHNYLACSESNEWQMYTCDGRPFIAIKMVCRRLRVWTHSNLNQFILGCNRERSRLVCFLFFSFILLSLCMATDEATRPSTQYVCVCV